MKRISIIWGGGRGRYLLLLLTPLFSPFIHCLTTFWVVLKTTKKIPTTKKKNKTDISYGKNESRESIEVNSMQFINEYILAIAFCFSPGQIYPKFTHTQALSKHKSFRPNPFFFIFASHFWTEYDQSWNLHIRWIFFSLSFFVSLCLLRIWLFWVPLCPFVWVFMFGCCCCRNTKGKIVPLDRI